jgi:hypothetical protein
MIASDWARVSGTFALVFDGFAKLHAVRELAG